MEEKATQEGIGEEEMIKKAKELLSTISYYPHITSYEEKERAKRALKRLYKKAPMKVKSNIIFGINEKLSSIRELRGFTRVEDIKATSPSELGRKLGTRVLNYENSLDGALEFLKLLLEFGDGLALKLFTYHLSRYLAMPPSYASRLLATSALSLLGECNHPYAVHFLLKTAMPEQSEIANAYLYALGRWQEKIDRVRMGKKERAFVKEMLSKLLMEDNDLSYTR